MKIAFKLVGGNSWYGGISYIRGFIFSLRFVNNKDLSLSLLVSSVSSDKKDVPLVLSKEVDEIIILPQPTKRWFTPWRVNQMLKKMFPINHNEERILKRHNVDIVFRSICDYGYSDIPTLSWIPDFQHIYFPEMFNDEERNGRDECFLKTAKVSTRVILMSESVKNDFEKFAPKYAYKARVLKTVSPIPETVYETDLNKIIKLYNLPEKFIYLPNQFWKHKNHEIVFDAIKILKDRSIQVLLTCTGFPGEYRHTGYFASLFQKISELGIRNHVIYLGMIPYEHVLLLIRQSICVLNPSLFEGFGLAVSEAKSLGKKVLLSDIPAHREQQHPKAMFFNPVDVDDLAEMLKNIWLNTSPGPDTQFEFEMRQNASKNFRLCGESFLSIIHELKNYNNRNS